MFEYEFSDRRHSYRISPSQEEPIVLTLDGKPVRVVNIGAGGLSFTNSGFRPGKIYLAKFDLPGQETSIQTGLRILNIDQQDICHCRFEGITGAQAEAIHQYVLERQKALLAEERLKAK